MALYDHAQCAMHTLKVVTASFLPMFGLNRATLEFSVERDEVIALATFSVLSRI